MSQIVELSSLSKTWILDLDGTIVKHNGYIIDGFDTLLPNIERLLCNIQKEDTVILLTARSHKFAVTTKEFLRKNNIRYNYILFDMPHGERIVINDNKASGLKTAVAVNTDRNIVPDIEFVRNSML